MSASDELNINPVAILRSAICGQLASVLPGQLVICRGHPVMIDLTVFEIRFVCPDCKRKFIAPVHLLDKDLHRAYADLRPLCRTVEEAITKFHP